MSVVSAVVALAAAIIGAVIVRWAIEPSQPVVVGHARQHRVYEAETAWLLVLLAISAMVGLRRPQIRPAATVLCGGFSLALAGTGAVAVRRWNTSKGFGSVAGNLSELRLLAALLAVAGAVAAAVCLIAVLRQPRPRWDAEAVVQVATGLLVVVSVPLAMGWEYQANRTTQFGAHALMYGIPWGVTIAVGAGATPTVRRVALAVPLLAGPLLLFDPPMIPGRDVRVGYLAAAALVVGCRVAQALVRDQRAGIEQHARLS